IALVGDPRDIPAPPRNFRCGRLCNVMIALLFFVCGIGVLPPRAKGVYAVARPHA
ncbi:MAG: hypothetical protein INR64_16365, partial [Caulobacteraceae bacterium]|nr:hypothetical protein [Caulobacter sp.]